MKTLILALLLSIATAVSAQDQPPSVQERIANYFSNAAPIYEFLLACDQKNTAELFLRDVIARTAPLAADENSQRILAEMWAYFRQQAQIYYRLELSDLYNNRDGDAKEMCDQLNSNIISQYLDSV